MAELTDKVVKELIEKQSQTITVLALRVTALEKILLKNNLIGSDELVQITSDISHQFIEDARNALQKLANENDINR